MTPSFIRTGFLFISALALVAGCGERTTSSARVSSAISSDPPATIGNAEANQAMAPSANVFTHIGAYNSNDQRQLYEIEVMRLALEKTRVDYGDYTMVAAPGMTHARALENMYTRTYANFARTFGYEQDLPHVDALVAIPFPVYRGIIGYRTCFTSPAVSEAFAAAHSIDELRKFSYAQGIGWADEQILEHNHFTVVPLSNYESLFKMTAAGRVDTFCRGANEVLDEYTRFKDQFGLSFDTSKVLHYPMPHFFYLNKADVSARERLQTGLIRAYQDGSFQDLWRQYHQRSLSFLQLHKRQIFNLENSLLGGIDPSYQQYLYTPGE